MISFYDEVCRSAWELFEQEISSRDDADYGVNEVQMSKLARIYAFFVEHGGEIEDFTTKPSLIHGGVTANFSLLYLDGDEINEFLRVLGTISSMSIDATTDGMVCISVTVPNVFYKK